MPSTTGGKGSLGEAAEAFDPTSLTTRHPPALQSTSPAAPAGLQASSQPSVPPHTPRRGLKALHSGRRLGLSRRRYPETRNPRTTPQRPPEPTTCPPALPPLFGRRGSPQGSQ